MVLNPLKIIPSWYVFWLVTVSPRVRMVYQMELRLSFSQQLAEGLRGGGHQLTDLYVIVSILK